MTFTIPSGIQTIYNEIADEFINSDLIGSDCTVVYPSIKEACVNCVQNTFGGSTPNVYRHGGPAPFNFGPCPVCGGSSFKETENTDTVRLRIYWSKKDWQSIKVPIQVPDGAVMTIGFLTDLPKIEQANEIILVAEQTMYKNWRYMLASEPFLHGFGKDRYFMAFWKRSG
jgi:hypothetical protein